MAALVVVTAVVFAAYTICLQCPPCFLFGVIVCLLEDRAADSMRIFGAAGVGEAPISVLRLCADPPIGGWRDVPTRVMMGT